MSRTRKQPYRGSRAFDATCRNHGSCGWCENNRLYATRKRMVAVNDQIKDTQKTTGLRVRSNAAAQVLSPAVKEETIWRI